MSEESAREKWETELIKAIDTGKSMLRGKRLVLAESFNLLECRNLLAQDGAIAHTMVFHDTKSLDELKERLAVVKVKDLLTLTGIRILINSFVPPDQIHVYDSQGNLFQILLLEES